MSYILDALKRADAERERGHVPGLHAQPLAGPAAAPAAGLPRWAVGAGAAACLVVVAALAWRLGADTSATVPATLAMPEPAPVAAALPAAPPRQAPPAAIPPADEPVALAPVPGAATPSRTMPTPPTAAPALPTDAPPAAARPAPPETIPSPNAQLPLYAQLPSGLRQQLPALKVTGSVYSEDAGARFIMLNGDVAKEGSQPAPDLVVERIEPKSAVLRFKGERFRLPY